MPPDLAEQFLTKGGEDERLLELVVDDQTVSESIYGFHVQQAIEKYVKAVLARFQVKVPKVHDIAYLLGRAEGAGAPSVIDVDRADGFTIFAVEDRYPFLSIGLPESRQDALDFVVEVRTWAEGVVRS
ncbi:MAG: HEPN domain-containing protein [Actinomycetota bacterium]